MMLLIRSKYLWLCHQINPTTKPNMKQDQVLGSASYISLLTHDQHHIILQYKTSLTTHKQHKIIKTYTYIIHLYIRCKLIYTNTHPSYLYNYYIYICIIVVRRCNIKIRTAS
ncbi:hypothetical protein AAZV13_08G270700 [Glycine max]